MSAAPITLYSVVSFGCNSGFNDMYPPHTRLFRDREEAYRHYAEMKQDIMEDGNPFSVYDDFVTKNTEAILQWGAGDGGAKRPVGAIIAKHVL